MRRLALLGALLWLAGCADAASPETPFPGQDQPSPTAPAPEPAPAPPTAAPKDACGAAEFQSLIGHPRTEIPPPIDPSRQRVACTTCPVTQEHNPERLNFFFDAQTGLIREIRCG